MSYFSYPILWVLLSKPLWLMDPSPSHRLFQPPGPALDSEWIGELNAGCEAGGFFVSQILVGFWVRKFCHGHTSWFNHQLYSYIFLEDLWLRSFLQYIVIVLLVDYHNESEVSERSLPSNWMRNALGQGKAPCFMECKCRNTKLDQQTLKSIWVN